MAEQEGKIAIQTRRSGLVAASLACLLTVSGAAPASAESASHSAIFVYGEPTASLAAFAVVNMSAPLDSITVSEDAHGLLRLRAIPSEFPAVLDWNFVFGAAPGQVLSVGEYSGALHPHVADDAGVPAINVSGNGAGCSETSGDFTIRELERDTEGTIVRLSASFRQKCAAVRDGYTYGELRYQSTQPWAAWSRSSGEYGFFSYDEQVVDTAAVPRPVWVRNRGTVPITLTAAIEGPNATDFSISDPDECMGELAVGAECRIQIGFSPSAKGVRDATLRVGDTHYGASETMRLTGAGVQNTFPQVTSVVGSYPAGVLVLGSIEPPDAGRIEFSVDGEFIDSEWLSTTSNRVYAPVGTREFRAHYSRSAYGYYLASTSEPVAYAVRVTTASALAFQPSSPRVGEELLIHASLRSVTSHRLAGGTLSIVDVQSGEPLATLAVSRLRSELAIRIRVTEAGPRTFEVRYSGDSLHAPSSESRTVTVVADGRDVAPPNGSLQINEGAPLTADPLVSLAISATDTPPGSSVSAMQLSAAGLPGTWTAWEPFATSRTWMLAGDDGQHTIFVRFRDHAGNVSPVANASILLDRVGPEWSAPEVSLPVDAVVGQSVPLQVTHGDAATEEATEITTQLSGNSGPWTDVYVGPGSQPYIVSLAPGKSLYQLRTRATDDAGHPGAWVAGAQFRLRSFQQSARVVRFGGRWSTKHNGAASGGSYRQSARRGAIAELSFSGSQVALVTRLGPDGGRAAIWIDGVRVTVVDLYAPTVRWARIAFQAPVQPGTHVLKVKVLRTKAPASTGHAVVIDAFVVIQ